MAESISRKMRLLVAADALSIQVEAIKICKEPLLERDEALSAIDHAVGIVESTLKQLKDLRGMAYKDKLLPPLPKEA